MKSLIISFFLCSIPSLLISAEWLKYDLNNLGSDVEFSTDLTFDSNTNLWLSTLGGLVKFDGTNWKVYNTSNSEIMWNELQSVAVDLNGNIWVGKSERNGISKFNGNVWEHISENNVANLDVYNVIDIVFDKDDNIWLATLLFLWTKQDNKWKNLKHIPEKDISKSNVFEVVLDKENNVWFTTRSYGLFKVVDNSLQNYSNGTTHNYEGLAIDSNNNVWFVNGSNSLMHYNQATKKWTVRDTTVTPLHNNTSKKNIIAVDRHNNLWIAEDRSVHFFNTIDETWKTYTIPESLQSINSPVLFNGFKIDNFGNLWFTTPDAGVYKLSGVISSVENEEQDTQIKLYPNPANSYLRVEHEASKQYTKFEIIDMSGKRMISGQFTTSEIDISNLASGVYIIKLFDLLGQQTEKKFVVE